MKRIVIIIIKLNLSELIYSKPNLYLSVYDSNNTNDDKQLVLRDDNHYYSQQSGNILLIAKKSQVDVQSLVLCSMDGSVNTQLQNVVGWGQFTFDLTYEIKRYLFD